MNCYFGCFYLSNRESEREGKLISVNYAANNFNCFNFVVILNYETNIFFNCLWFQAVEEN